MGMGEKQVLRRNRKPDLRDRLWKLLRQRLMPGRMAIRTQRSMPVERTLRFGKQALSAIIDC